MSEPSATPQPLLPARPEQGRALLTVLAVMAVLAALSLLFSRGADRLSDRWDAQLSQTSTVQVMIASEELRDAQMEQAAAILSDVVPAADIQPLSRDDAAALLRPWLGSASLPDDLPVPGVIRLETRAVLPVTSLERRFEADGLRVVIDDHSRFSGQLERTVGRLVALGAALVGLTLIAALAVSAFATRAGLAAQRDIIHVLVQAGASDLFISRLFIAQAARHGGIGAAIGIVVAAVLWLLVSFGMGRGSVGWRGLGDGIVDAVWLVALVGAFAMICAAAAGWAASRQLADERRRA